MDKIKLPVHILVLDTVGAILAGVGLYEWFSGSSLVPERYHFANYYVIMVVVGLLLMGPALMFIINKARRGDKKSGPREI
ncbi:MAG: DUF1418 family protein [Acidiferrobacterales bacterium]|nr:DUF1418 family protein [Acidiferrobacterales bacterium]